MRKVFVKLADGIAIMGQYQRVSQGSHTKNAHNGCKSQDYHTGSAEPQMAQSKSSFIQSVLTSFRYLTSCSKCFFFSCFKGNQSFRAFRSLIDTYGVNSRELKASIAKI